MSGHLFKFTVEHLEDLKGNSIESEPLIFETRTHEDLFKIIEMMKGKADLAEEDIATFAIGLKLFGEVMMKNKDKKVFKDFKPYFANFMKEFKQSVNNS